MAGDWLKIEADTPDKPEILAMSAMLNLDTDCVFGKCFRIWRWFDAHTEKGNARSVTSALLNRMVGVTDFAQAMEKVGWLVEDERGVTLPHFDRHNGKTAKTRALTAKRVLKSKKSNASSVTSALPKAQKSNAESVSASSLSLLSNSSLLNSVLEGTSFDTEVVREKMADWISHYERLAGTKTDAVKLRTTLAECRRKGWDGEKLIDSIAFSMEIDSKRLRGREDDLDAQRKNGKPRPSIDDTLKGV